MRYRSWNPSDVYGYDDRVILGVTRTKTSNSDHRVDHPNQSGLDPATRCILDFLYPFIKHKINVVQVGIELVNVS